MIFIMSLNGENGDGGGGASGPSWESTHSQYIMCESGEKSRLRN